MRGSSANRYSITLTLPSPVEGEGIVFDIILSSWRNRPMRRRTFIKHTAAAGAAAVASAKAPLLLGMEDKSGSKNPVIGTGEYRYECIHGWGELP